MNSFYFISNGEDPCPEGRYTLVQTHMNCVLDKLWKKRTLQTASPALPCSGGVTYK